jgi:hypothetical protein
VQAKSGKTVLAGRRAVRHLSGVTGTTHRHCLLELRALTERSLSEIRLAPAVSIISFNKP